MSSSTTLATIAYFGTLVGWCVERNAKPTQPDHPGALAA